MKRNSNLGSAFILSATLINTNPVVAAKDDRASTSIINTTEVKQQTDLSGTYIGIVNYPKGGLYGYATLTITGNQVSLENGATTLTGRIAAVTTRNYTAAALQLDKVPPTILSLRAVMRDRKLTLVNVPEEKQAFSFTTEFLPGTGRPRGSKGSKGSKGGRVPEGERMSPPPGRMMQKGARTAQDAGVVPKPKAPAKSRSTLKRRKRPGT